MNLFDEARAELEKEMEIYINAYKTAWGEFIKSMTAITLENARIIDEQVADMYYSQYSPKKYKRSFTIYDGFLYNERDDGGLSVDFNVSMTNAFPTGDNTFMLGHHGGPVPFASGNPPVFIGSPTMDSYQSELYRVYDHGAREEQANSLWESLCASYGIDFAPLTRN